MHPPPGGCIEIFPTRDFHLVGKHDLHGAVGVVCCDPNGDPIRGSHWDRIEATVRPELTRDGDNNAIACAVTLEEGQGDSELHCLVGGEA